ncbi:NAD(P)/FAD-dependent oxidoreductase [Pedobacter sp. B4-66]|uniref:NAD(P)/FAD-dependent oxidoreductase n=1 Tax=Pedobacter sp. B4-66 TaxID=2817280 RepID=UPI001BD93730|nr:NAD(P)/FAD-dependent oxidoreductase [Pedobacter sp. B4-66]
MKKRIIIIGGGFAGLNVARNIDNKEYQITLVDRNNYIFFPPLLYQVATGFLEPSSISYPYRKMLRNKSNLNFKLGEVLNVIPEQNKIILTTGELEYDYLVFATGTETNYFGMENVEKKAIPMKTINDALEMRNYFLRQLERATTFTSYKNRLKKVLTIVVAGGGPTGVEISGMLAEMQTSVFRKDYPEFEKVRIQSHIYIVDGSAQLLSPMSKKSQDDTYRKLEEMGVKIILNAQVTDYVDDKVILSNGQFIETENLIWAAGVTSQLFNGIPSEYYGRGRRLITDAHNKIEGLKNIYAVGDTSIQTTDSDFPGGHPQVAQVALQQGKNLANNFNRLLRNKPLTPFKYNDRGSMAIIGRNKAVADIPPNLHFKGFIAWVLWIFIHLISLVHYRNRITTVYNWIVAYFTKDQALRMMIRPTAPSVKTSATTSAEPIYQYPEV